jgi:hypothetical protein
MEGSYYCVLLQEVIDRKNIQKQENTAYSSSWRSNKNRSLKKKYRIDS